MKCNMKCEYTSIILALLITLFVCMILYHIVYSTMEGMDALDSAKNYLANNISVSSNLADRISTLKDQQPPSPTLSSPMAVVTMDSVMKDVYKPIQVNCTIQDCSMADNLMKQGVNIAADNYFNDGFRNCNANKCNQIRTLWKTMTPMDSSGAYFKDDKGLVYDFLGNPVTK